MITDTALQVASDLAHRDALTESERDALGVALDALDDDTTAHDRPCVGCAHLVTFDRAGYSGFCGLPNTDNPLTGNGLMPGWQSGLYIDWRAGRCAGYQREAPPD